MIDELIHDDAERRILELQRDLEIARAAQAVLTDALRLLVADPHAGLVACESDYVCAYCRATPDMAADVVAQRHETGCPIRTGRAIWQAATGGEYEALERIQRERDAYRRALVALHNCASIEDVRQIAAAVLERVGGPGTTYVNSHTRVERCIGCGKSNTPLNAAGRCLRCELAWRDGEG